MTSGLIIAPMLFMNYSKEILQIIVILAFGLTCNWLYDQKIKMKGVLVEHENKHGQTIHRLNQKLTEANEHLNSARQEIFEAIRIILAKEIRAASKITEIKKIVNPQYEFSDDSSSEESDLEDADFSPACSDSSEDNSDQECPCNCKCYVEKYSELIWQGVRNLAATHRTE